jgi:hypothetical protein
MLHLWSCLLWWCLMEVHHFRRVCWTFPTVWCIHSQIAFASWGFTWWMLESLILHPWRRNWNSGQTNSLPLLCMQRSGQGYLDNQNWAYFLALCADVFSSILTSSTKLDTVSVTERALNSYSLLQTWIIYGPIKSKAHSSIGTGTKHHLHSGSKPYGKQISSHGAQNITKVMSF